jgi:hypothetical protein
VRGESLARGVSGDLQMRGLAVVEHGLELLNDVVGARRKDRVDDGGASGDQFAQDRGAGCPREVDLGVVLSGTVALSSSLSSLRI